MQRVGSFGELINCSLTEEKELVASLSGINIINIYMYQLPSTSVTRTGSLSFLAIFLGVHLGPL